MDIVIKRTADWEALYIDGEKALENHSLPTYAIVEAMGYDYEDEYIPEDEVDLTTFPERLEGEKYDRT
jgi:hypothetical protein